MDVQCVRFEHCRRAESNGRERGKGGAACSVGYMEAVEAEVPKQVEQNQQPRLGDISLCRRVPHAVMLSHPSIAETDRNARSSAEPQL